MPNRNSKFPESTSTGVISRIEIYSINEIKRRMCWSDAALRAARRKGLRLLVCGKRRYVSGEEIARFLESISP